MAGYWSLPVRCAKTNAWDFSGIGVYLIGCRGLVFDEPGPRSREFTDVFVDFVAFGIEAIRAFGFCDGDGPFRQHRFRDTKQIKAVGGGDHVFSRILRFERVDPHHEISFRREPEEEIFHIRGQVFATDKNVRSRDFPAGRRAFDLFGEKFNTLPRVAHGKGFLEDFPVAVADQGDVFTFGEIHVNAEDFLVRLRGFKNAGDVGILILVN